MEVEGVLTHDGRVWIFYGEGFRLEGRTLEELDERVRELARSWEQAGRKVRRVYMYFDTETLPQWMRQYSQHYFNRILDLEVM